MATPRGLKRDAALWKAIGEPFFAGAYFYVPIPDFLSDGDETIADECALLSLLKKHKKAKVADHNIKAMERYPAEGGDFYKRAVITHFYFRWVFWYNDLFTNEIRRTRLSEIATEEELGQILVADLAKKKAKNFNLNTYFEVPEDFQLTDKTLLNVLYDYIIRKKEHVGFLQDPTIFEKYAKDEELQKFKKGGPLHSLVPSRDDIQKQYTRELYLFYLEQPDYLSKTIIDTSKATDRRKGAERFLAMAKLFY